MKNLKLTNISLAVLVALGLVACGGSNDSTDHTTDKDKIELEKQKIEAEKKKLEEAKKKQEEEQKRLQEEKEKLEKEKKEDKGKQETPKVDDKNKPETEKTVTKVQRYNPTLEVPDDAKGAVASAKKFAVRRGFSNDALGYTFPDRTKYNKDKGTDPADILHTSTYNFSKEKDVIIVNGSSVTGDFPVTAKGAINISKPDEINSGKANAFVKGKSGTFYRVKSKVGKTGYKSDTNFEFVGTDPDDKNTFLADTGMTADNVKQSAIVFLANAKEGNPADRDTYIIKASKAASYDIAKLGEVRVNDFVAIGKSYKSDALNQKLDLSNYKVDPNNIQVEDIVAHYDISNNKNSANSDDDKTVSAKTTVGKMKIYNLPYSVAFVTTNPAADDKKDIFKINNGEFQLNGMDAIALPKNGRAKYTGKSFNASVEGNIELFADFSLNAAGVNGRVYDRVDHANNDEALQELTLERIQLSSPNSHSTKGLGKVTGDDSYAQAWSVRLFGLDAQEAGGYLYDSMTIDPTTGKITIPSSANKVEVYNTRREELTDKSNEVSNTD